MKKALQTFGAILLLSGFLVACDGGDAPDAPSDPGAPIEQQPGGGGEPGL